MLHEMGISWYGGEGRGSNTNGIGCVTDVWDVGGRHNGVWYKGLRDFKLLCVTLLT